MHNLHMTRVGLSAVQPAVIVLSTSDWLLLNHSVKLTFKQSRPVVVTDSVKICCNISL